MGHARWRDGLLIAECVRAQDASSAPRTAPSACLARERRGRVAEGGVRCSNRWSESALARRVRSEAPRRAHGGRENRGRSILLRIHGSLRTAGTVLKFCTAAV
jgi:hypothetical protein